MKKFVLSVCAILFTALSAMGQNQQVTGTVTSEKGTPLSGVTVLLAGTRTGVITDAAGNFSINAPANSTLRFSYLGLEPQMINIGQNRHLNIVLKEESAYVGQVVVTALGMTKSEKTLTYSAAQVGAEELARGANSSPLSGLQGRFAGINISTSSGAPGASNRIVLRGYSSISGSNEPLFIVDGVPVSNAMVGSTSLGGGIDFGNAINDLDPNAIENMSVLKGAAATALYGSRASNGVIIITTKKGARASEGVRVEFSSSVKMQSVAYLPYLQNRFGQGWNGMHYLDENGSWGPKFDDQYRVWGNIVDGQQLYKKYSGQPSSLKDFFDTGMIYTNGVAVSGGSEKTTYYMSVSNTYQDGILPANNDTYKRNTASFRGQTTGDILSSTYSVNYINKKVSQAQSGQGLSVYNNLMQIPRDVSIVDMKNYHNKFYNLDNFYTNYGVANPYYTLNEDGNTLIDDRVFGSVDLSGKILPWISATIRGGVDYSAFASKQWRAITEPEGHNAGASFANVGSVSDTQGTRMEFTFDAFTQLNPTISDNFTLNALLGYNLNMRSTKNTSESVTKLDLPGWYHISNSPSTPAVTYRDVNRRIIGAYASVDLGYKNYLFMNLAFRNDWSSTLPKENRSYFYPSVGISTVLTDAIPELKKAMSFAKLRVSYGETGNDSAPYNTKSVYVKREIGSGFGNGLTFPLGGVNAFSVSNTIGNPYLKPERTREFEVGADFRFLNNRIGFDITYYNGSTSDQILAVNIPSSTGASWAVMNIGKVTNKGFEIVANFIPIRNSDWLWSITANFARNRNKLVELSDLLNDVTLNGTTNLLFKAKIGMPLGYYETCKAKRDDQGRIVVNASGLPIRDSEFSVVGDMQADFTAGLASSLRYKNISLTANVDIRKGGKVFSRTADINYFVGNAQQTMYNDRNPFVVPNSVYEASPGVYVENTIPIAKANINSYWDNGGVLFDEAYLLSKTFVRLREVVVSYEFPKKWFEHTRLGGITLSAIGNNLLVWRPRGNKFIDPEASTFGNNLAGEYGEFSGSPSVRNYGFSLRVLF